jgi:hypothetical protein
MGGRMDHASKGPQAPEMKTVDGDLAVRKRLGIKIGAKSDLGEKAWAAKSWPWLGNMSSHIVAPMQDTEQAGNFSRWTPRPTEKKTWAAKKNSHLLIWARKKLKSSDTTNSIDKIQKSIFWLQSK